MHLSDPHERNSQTLLRFFASLKTQENLNGFKVFLLGDIFDLWVSDHDVFQQRWKDLLVEMADLQKAGVEFVYFEGNHDMHLAPYWQRVLHAQVLTSASTFDISGYKIRCEHGDEINQEDKNYLLLRSFLRSPVVEWLAHSLPGFFWDSIGQKMSTTSRKYSSLERSSHQEKMKSLIRRHAQKTWTPDQPFDVIISGHMHVEDDWTFQMAGKEIRSINLGSWFDRARVLFLGSKKIEWKDLS